MRTKLSLFVISLITLGACKSAPLIEQCVTAKSNGNHIVNCVDDRLESPEYTYDRVPIAYWCTNIDDYFVKLIITFLSLFVSL